VNEIDVCVRESLTTIANPISNREIAILVAGLKRLAKAPNAPNAEGQVR
jgi:hypothetical protein